MAKKVKVTESSGNIFLDMLDYLVGLCEGGDRRRRASSSVTYTGQMIARKDVRANKV